MHIDNPSVVASPHRPHPFELVVRHAPRPIACNVPGLSIWGNSTLTVRDLGDGTFTYQLRSRVNVPILSGGPMRHAGDPMAAGRALLDLCAQERALRVDETPEGRFVCLIDSDRRVLGRSARIEGEALARATLRLLALQARAARVVFQKFPLTELDSRTV